MTTTIDISKVTPELLDLCHRIYDENHNNEVFYIVESRTEAGKEYIVRYLKGKGLTCTCPAGNPPCDERGYLKYAPRMCWHIPAACAAAALYREEQAEQSKLTRLVNQGVSREVAQCITYANDHPYQYSELEVKRAMHRNQREAFSILR